VVAPIIGAVSQTLPTRYRLERRDPKTHQQKTAWVVFRDEYQVGDQVRWGYGARWTVAEVRK
jgi:hypothetical protein